MDISENYVEANDPEVVKKGFIQGASTVTIKNGNIETHYLFQEMVAGIKSWVCEKLIACLSGSVNDGQISKL